MEIWLLCAALITSLLNFYSAANALRRKSLGQAWKIPALGKVWGLAPKGKYVFLSVSAEPETQTAVAVYPWAQSFSQKTAFSY